MSINNKPIVILVYLQHAGLHHHHHPPSVENGIVGILRNVT